MGVSESGTTRKKSAARAAAKPSRSKSVSRKRSKNASKLTPKQARFCEEYLADMNGSQAAIRAGYSAHTARQAATRLLSKAHIQERVSKLRDELSERAGVTAEDVIRELDKLARANMLDYVNVQQDGTAYVDLSKLDRDQAAAIQEITTEEYMEGRDENAVPVRKIRFKLADKKGALDSLAKYFGLFVERHRHEVGEGVEVNVRISHAPTEA